jgi:hypothetical protein
MGPRSKVLPAADVRHGGRAGSPLTGVVFPPSFALSLVDVELEGLVMKDAKVSSRRDLLKVAGAGLVAAAAPSVAAAEHDGGGGETLHPDKPVYLWGCGWNRELPGVFGEVCLTFEMRALLNGTGVGTFRDDVHPEVNSQWRVERAKRQGNTYTFEGTVISSRDPALVGQPVKIVAKKTASGQGSASIIVGSEEGNLVVIAIIVTLIGLLLPFPA